MKSNIYYAMRINRDGVITEVWNPGGFRDEAIARFRLWVIGIGEKRARGEYFRLDAVFSNGGCETILSNQ